jgi:fucose permease
MPFSIALLIAVMVTARLTAKFTAKRLIQVGFLIAIVGIVALEITVQPGFTAASVASGGLFGIGLGMILPQTLNLVLSLASDKDTAETAGLNGTFEQLGNAAGVALVGTVMLVVLNFGLGQGIEASTTLAADDQQQLMAAVDEGVQLMSGTQVTEQLATVGADAAEIDEVLAIYEVSRVNGFRAGVAFLLFIALVGLVLSLGLPNRMLVEAER